MDQVLTDGRGRYALQAFDTRTAHLRVLPPEGMDYRETGADVDLAADARVRDQDFALEPGSVVTGVLREQETGQPLRVPDVAIHYRSEGPEPVLAGTHTRPDGSYRLVVSPGRGELYTYEAPAGCAPRDVSEEDLRHGPYTQKIDVKAGETLTGKDFHFLRGLVVHGRVLDPEGRPVAGAVFYGVAPQAPSGADGTFTLRGLSPEQKSQFLVVHTGRGLGVGLTVVPPPGTNPVALDVRLQPARPATGRVTDPDGRPVAHASVSLLTNLRLREGAGGFSFRPVPVYGPVRTDAAGNFRLPALAVGGSYTVAASGYGYASVQAHFRVEEGKEPEVPALVLPANRLALVGVVVDPAGNPVGGVEVTALPRDPAVAASSSRSLRTGADGRFRFAGLPAGAYRLIVTLWKPTGATDPGGNPVHRMEAHTELRVEAGQTGVRVTLAVP
jgi:Carboxypeptidase regulatory-like domain